MIAPEQIHTSSLPVDDKSPGGPTVDRQNEFRVRLDDVFTGPMDLLLHLVREHEVDVTEISLARICGAFLRHVRDLAELDLAVTGDYLVVAATLLAIKSRALLPTGEEVEMEEDVVPGDDLVRRLLQYRRVREASRELALLSTRRAATYTRGENEMPPIAPGEIDLGDLSAWDLLATFAKILRDTGGTVRTHQIGTPERRVAEYATDLGGRLRISKKLLFKELFLGAKSRQDVIGIFLAVLELCKQGAIKARQDGPFAEIEVERTLDDLEQFDRLVLSIASPQLQLEAEAASAEGEDAFMEDSTDSQTEPIVPVDKRMNTNFGTASTRSAVQEPIN